ncbi:Rpr2-domain-containing protein [Xylariomycetidae sp. FL2044]|nr:Rpr2-domain-containing protein [Xylariomycetidae sp. FL2044]
MGKSKAGTVPNKPVYSRLSYLYQAASYLGVRHEQHPTTAGAEAASARAQDSPDSNTASKSRARRALSRRLLSDFRAVSLKTQIRTSPAIKHSICKFCDTLMIEGDTSSSIVENKSKGGKKPWADVLVVTCHTCGGVRRFPVQAPRQKRRPVRLQEAKESIKQTHQDPDVEMKIG